MGTKVYTLEQGVEKKPLKAICLDEYLLDDGRFQVTYIHAGVYDHIMLLRRGYAKNKDLIYALNEDGTGCLYLGYWNDGVV